jgi:probable F420-dependent oxidoreductase
MTRPFRFGVQASAPLPGRTWAETAQHVESLGYSSLLLPDHFGDQLAPVPAMMAAAAATTTLRVGALVFDNDYKHPVVLAKEMATVDVLSGGRVEFGLGAGWMRTDYETSGIPYDPPGVRVDRFEEAIAVYRGAFSGEPFDFDGTHYQIRGLEGRPRPTRPGGPPLLIGGGGRRMLRIAGREADIVSVNPNMAAGEVTAATALDALAPAIDEKIGWLREGAGDRFGDLELSITLFFCQVTDDGATAAEAVGSMFGVGAAEVADCPILAIGTTSEIADALVARRERWGFSYLLCQLEAAEALAPVVAQLAGQ